MTKNTATQSLTAKPLLFTGTGVLALALLTGCSTAADDPATTPAPEQATTSAPAEAESTTPATDESGTPADEQQPNAGGNDPVFDAIAVVTAEHGDGFIVSIDRDDRDEHYEIDVVVGEQVLDLKVGLDGTITEDEQDSDDDIQKAQQATVDAETALKRAFESRAEGLTVDDVELDEDDDRLVWEIDFDDADGKDSDEVVIDAQDGSVVRDSAA